MDTYAEIRKLYAMLNEANIPCTLARLFDGWQVRVYADEDMTRELDDAILHSGSHGCRNGLLETYTLGGCEGWETAEQVFKGWKKMYEEANKKG